MQQLIYRAEGVWSVNSGVPGPSVAIVGGTHGNERTGYEVILKLCKAIKTGSFEILKGTLTLCLGNPKAIAKNTRGSDEGADLNRCFMDEILDGEGVSYEAQRARELANLLCGIDVGIDLHATNKPSMPFIVSQATVGPLAMSLIACLRASVVLTDPDWVFAGTPVTLDEFFGRNGGIGLCYETGFASDTSRVDNVISEMLSCLTILGMMRGAPVVGHVPQAVYELVECITLTEAGFAYVEGFGEYNFQPIQAGQCIGSHGSSPHIVYSEGVIVFPKIKALWKVGAPVGYIAKKV